MEIYFGCVDDTGVHEVRLDQHFEKHGNFDCLKVGNRIIEVDAWENRLLNIILKQMKIKEIKEND